ncbi:MAG: D-alanyl-D-alanine carboxypeptidase [Actinomycetales bacterium]|nr:D-alanyl-D-alanine carboxypeptidase [Actinomycetales bacterium]
MTIVTLASVLVPASSAHAAPAARPVEPVNDAESRLSQLLDKRLADRALGRDVSVAVIDVATDRLVTGHRASVSMLPASNMKVITAVNTLSALDPEQRFVTRTLAGDRPNEVILQGGGDPLLTTANLKTLARRTSVELQRGRRVILRLDDHLIPRTGRAPGWPRDYQPSAAAPVRALALIGDYSMRNQANAVEAFRRALADRGFTVVVRTGTTAPANARVLAQVDPHTVRQAVNVMLLWSENNVAELLFRHVAIATGEPANWPGARRAAMRQLTALGIDAGILKLMDGSGLSRADRMTALTLAQVIRLSRTDPRFASMYAPKGMPTSGISGTLDDRYGRYRSGPSRCARGDIRAKTGTLFDSIGLTGITTAADGQEKAFSILVNERPQRVSPLTTRQAVDGLAATIHGCW